MEIYAGNDTDAAARHPCRIIQYHVNRHSKTKCVQNKSSESFDSRLGFIIIVPFKSHGADMKPHYPYRGIFTLGTTWMICHPCHYHIHIVENTYSVLCWERPGCGGLSSMSHNSASHQPNVFKTKHPSRLIRDSDSSFHCTVYNFKCPDVHIKFIQITRLTRLAESIHKFINHKALMDRKP